MVSKDVKDSEEDRQKRMDALEARIEQTPSGERFLRRVYEIGKPKPLRPESKEDQGE